MTIKVQLEYFIPLANVTSDTKSKLHDAVDADQLLSVVRVSTEAAHFSRVISGEKFLTIKGKSFNDCLDEAGIKWKYPEVTTVDYCSIKYRLIDSVFSWSDWCNHRTNIKLHDYLDNDPLGYLTLKVLNAEFVPWSAEAPHLPLCVMDACVEAVFLGCNVVRKGPFYNYMILADSPDLFSRDVVGKVEELPATFMALFGFLRLLNNSTTELVERVVALAEHSRQQRLGDDWFFTALSEIFRQQNLDAFKDSAPPIKSMLTKAA